MSNIILTVHLILALLLISVVLMQRSDGGGLGSAGGSNGGLISGRTAATAITKLTWFFAVAFLCTSITLTILSAKKTVSESIVIEDTSENDGSLLSVPLPDAETLKSIGSTGAPTLPPVNE